MIVEITPTLLLQRGRIFDNFFLTNHESGRYHRLFLQIDVDDIHSEE